MSIGFRGVTRPILQTGLHALVKLVCLETNDNQYAKSVSFSGGFCCSFHVWILPRAI